MQKDLKQSRAALKKALLTTQSSFREDGKVSQKKLRQLDGGLRPVEGSVKVVANYEDGSSEVLLEDNNLVVTQAETVMAQIMVGARTMSYIELGDPSPPTPPVDTDIALESTTGERKAVTASFDGNVAEYAATWGTSEANGLSITEFGLFSSPFGSGLLFARKITRNPVVKTSSFSFTITWAITFRVSDINDGCSGVSLVGNSSVTDIFLFTAAGGETEVTVPITFTVGANDLDVFLERQRLYPTVDYVEAVIGGGPAQGVTLLSTSLVVGEQMLFVKRTIS